MDCLKDFLQINRGFGEGDGVGSGSDEGTGYSTGYSTNYGYNYSYGSGYGYGGGSGAEYGYGSGSGYEYGYGSGVEYGYGSGCGAGFCYDYGSGCGAGVGSGSGIKSINKRLVHYIDGVSTIIEHVHGNFAKGKILHHDLTITPCFVAKSNNRFAHGETLKRAMNALQDKLFDGMSDDERIDAFVGEFPSLETVVKNIDLFDWHNKLTGSCEMGRKEFVVEKDINLNAEMTVREFIDLTKNKYAGDIIKKLLEHYIGGKDGELN